MRASTPNGLFLSSEGAPVYCLGGVAGGGRADTADVVDGTDGKLALQMAQPAQQHSPEGCNKRKVFFWFLFKINKINK